MTARNDTTSWGVLYYAFPVLAGDITAATDWPTTAITALRGVGRDARYVVRRLIKL